MLKRGRKGLQWQDKATCYSQHKCQSAYHKMSAVFDFLYQFQTYNVQTCSNHEKNDMIRHVYIQAVHTPERREELLPLWRCHRRHLNSCTLERKLLLNLNLFLLAVSNKNRITQRDISYIIYQFETKQRGWSLSSTSWHDGLNLSECRSKPYQSMLINFPSFLHKSLDASANKACGDGFCLEPHTQLFSLFTPKNLTNMGIYFEFSLYIYIYHSLN